MTDKKRVVLGLLQSMEAGTLKLNLFESMGLLLSGAKDCGLSVELAYHSGMFAKPLFGEDGKMLTDENGLPQYGEPFHDPKMDGYTVTVSNYYTFGEDGTQEYFTDLPEVIACGLGLLQGILEDDDA